MENEVNASGFVFPELHCGMAVDVSWNVGFSKPRLGIVCKPKSNSASILVWTEEGPMFYADCRHRADPRILTNPEWLTEDSRNRCIFEVSEVERRRLRSDQTLARAMTILDELVADVVRLKEAVGLKDIPKPKIDPVVAEKKAEIAEMVRRGPGRPRTLTPVGAE